MVSTTSIEQLSDRDLLDVTQRVAGDGRQLTAQLLALLGEVETRRLYLGQGCSSPFAYCTEVLHFSEHAAYHRIEAARAARQFPVILDLVAEGALTLTSVAMLRPHLTTENHSQVLEAARHKTKDEVKYQIGLPGAAAGPAGTGSKTLNTNASTGDADAPPQRAAVGRHSRYGPAGCADTVSDHRSHSPNCDAAFV